MMQCIILEQDRKYGSSRTRVPEANLYFNVTCDDNGYNIESRVTPTAYAIDQGAYSSQEISEQTSEGKGAGRWWLRSPGFHQSDATCVYTDGMLYSRDPTKGFCVVRPALWLNLESSIF